MSTLRLKYAIDLEPGFAFPASGFSDERGTPVARIRDVLPGTTELYFDGHVADRWLIDSGDLLVGMDGDFPLGWWRGGPAALNQRVGRVSARPGADLRFLSYAIPPVLAMINETTYTTTVKHFSRADLLRQFVPFPSLSQQRRLVEFLDRETNVIDRAIAVRRRQIALLDEIRVAEFESELVQKSAGSVSLRRVLRRPIAYGLNVAGEVDRSEEWPRYIRTSDILDVFTLRTDGVQRIDPELARAAPVHPGDVLITRSGTVGKAYLHDGIHAAHAGYLLRLQTDQSLCLPSWLAVWTQTRHFKDQVELGSVQSTISNLNASRVGDFRLPLISAEDQRRMVARFLDASPGPAVIGRSTELLRELRHSLIAATVESRWDEVGSSTSAISNPR